MLHNLARVSPTRLFRLTAVAFVAALTLSGPVSGMALAAGPVVPGPVVPGPILSGGQLDGLPLTVEPLDTLGQQPGSGDVSQAAPEADPSSPTDCCYAVRPTRVWTTDRNGYRRSTFSRGETIVFWVQLYNPTNSYARHYLELWADDQIRCITYPCDGGPQRLFSGGLYVRPGYTNYYLFARAELDDKVGEWTYYATDPQQRTFVATKFYLY